MILWHLIININFQLLSSFDKMPMLYLVLDYATGDIRKEILNFQKK